MIYGIAQCVLIQVHAVASEQGRVPREPAADFRVILPDTKVRQPRVRVVKPARKCEWLKSRVGVLNDAAIRIVVNALRNHPAVYAHDETHTTQLVCKNAIDLTRLDDVVGHVCTTSVYKDAAEVT